MAKTPKLSAIDHVHVYVDDRAAAEKWYADVLDFHRIEALMSWAVKGGPLTIGNTDNTIHLALFERPDHPQTSALAFGTSGPEFLAWQAHFLQHDIAVRVTDHALAYSLYFSDPWGNMHEITSWDRDYIARHLTP